ncbi:hypothetical protein Plim_2847 [Planctopirus limnophila DSM 3776]|uniref:Uncharacterized protein n=1 Tax=Planctopirus limnophila (strain ATCC 43296 / DSM 3776 / IFAM 1008 / Mu 290) TaxID=521674 RepID=D5SRH6_PLAL2|nr:hypothetical protein [Planctopirus limnophila]ADG68669.1 hypothetical protein Plim_2847 [Planctopirus limnophila DSM 3776]
MPKTTLFDELVPHLKKKTGSVTRIYFRRGKVRPGDKVAIKRKDVSTGDIAFEWTGDVEKWKGKFVLVKLYCKVGYKPPTRTKSSVPVVDEDVVEVVVTVTAGTEPVDEETIVVPLSDEG